MDLHCDEDFDDIEAAWQENKENEDPNVSGEEQQQRERCRARLKRHMKYLNYWCATHWTRPLSLAQLFEV